MCPKGPTWLNAKIGSTQLCYTKSGSCLAAIYLTYYLVIFLRMWQLSHFKNWGLYVQKMIHSMISSLYKHIKSVNHLQKHQINGYGAYQSFLKSTGQLFSIKRWSIWRNLGLKLFLKTFLMAFLNHFVLHTLCSKIKQLRSVLRNN